jgi:hypothetical protein
MRVMMKIEEENTPLPRRFTEPFTEPFTESFSDPFTPRLEGKGMEGITYIRSQ